LNFQGTKYKKSDVVKTTKMPGQTVNAMKFSLLSTAELARFDRACRDQTVRVGLCVVDGHRAVLYFAELPSLLAAPACHLVSVDDVSLSGMYAWGMLSIAILYLARHWTACVNSSRSTTGNIE
jgi:hypothetical protein